MHYDWKSIVITGQKERLGSEGEAPRFAAPADFIQFLREYGPGYTVPERLRLYGQSRDRDWDLLAINVDYSPAIKWLIQNIPLPLPPLSFPEPGSLTIFGGTPCGALLAWVTDGPPDEWPIIVFHSRDGAGNDRLLDMRFSEFLVRFIADPEFLAEFKDAGRPALQTVEWHAVMPGIVNHAPRSERRLSEPEAIKAAKPPGPDEYELIACTRHSIQELDPSDRPPLSRTDSDVWVVKMERVAPGGGRLPVGGTVWALVHPGSVSFKHRPPFPE